MWMLKFNIFTSNTAIFENVSKENAFYIGFVIMCTRFENDIWED